MSILIVHGINRLEGISMKLNKQIGTIFLLLFIVSCDSSPTHKNSAKEENQDKTYSIHRENLTANGKITINGNEACFSFSKGKDVECDLQKNTWDIRLSGWNIFTNGGISGEHSGGGVSYNGSSYGEIETSDVPGMALRDSYGSVFDNWFETDMTAFTLSSKGDVYLVRSRSETYKVSILSYYGEALGAPVSAIFTIRYANIKTPTEIFVVEHINATAGGTLAKGDGAYFSFSNGILKEMTDGESKSSQEWDLRFKRYNIHLNSGVSGPSNVTGVKLNTTDFDAIDETFLPNENEFEKDRIRPIVDKWGLLNSDGVVEFSDSIYVLLTGDGKAWYKFYPLSVSGATASGYKEITFRFDRLK